MNPLYSTAAAIHFCRQTGEADVTEDVLNHAFLLNQGDQLHFAATFRAK